MSTLITARPNGGEAAQPTPRTLAAARRGAPRRCRPALRRARRRRLEPIERRRRDFLLAQLTAAATRLRMLQGERLSFAEEARRPVTASGPSSGRSPTYDPVLARIERLVPGAGPLAERVDAFQDRFIIPRDRLEPVMRAAIAECRRRTLAHIPLPRRRALHAGVRHRQELVAATIGTRAIIDSLIQVNTDLPVRIGRAVDLGCHEGYPGHHVLQHAARAEAGARARLGRISCVYPLYSPQIASSPRARPITASSSPFRATSGSPSRRARPLPARRPADRRRRRLSRAAGRDAGPGRRPLHHRRATSRRPDRPRRRRSR